MNGPHSRLALEGWTARSEQKIGVDLGRETVSHLVDSGGGCGGRFIGQVQVRKSVEQRDVNDNQLKIQGHRVGRIRAVTLKQGTNAALFIVTAHCSEKHFA